MKIKWIKNYVYVAVALVLAFTALLCNFSLSPAYAADVDVKTEQKVWDKDEVTTIETLRQVPIEQITQWDSYDSREYGIITKVRNQNNYNLCWAYGSIDAMEASLLREGVKIDLPQNAILNMSPLALAKATKGFFDDPLNLSDCDNPTNFGGSLTQTDWNVGGNLPVVSLVASRWFGVYNYTDFYSYTDPETNQVRATEGYSPYRVEKAVTCENSVQQIKELVATYGSAVFAYYASNLSGSYYYAPYGGANHVSSIVGWDDNVTAQTFRDNGFSQVTKDGAWIVKNTWGTTFHTQGYYYMSYQSSISEVTAFDMMGADDYDYNYNYSGTAPSAYLTTYDGRYNFAGHNDYIAVYQAQNGSDSATEYLKGVSVGVKGQNVIADIKVYTNINKDEIATFNPETTVPDVETRETFKYEGIYTVELPDMVEVAKDSYYLIYVNLNLGAGIIYEKNGSLLSDNDLTFFNDGSYNWVNFREALDNNKNRTYGVAAIKGLTVLESETKPSISSCEITLNQTAFTYNGNAHTPTPTVKLNGTTLIQGQDYTVFYENNVNAGQGTVKIVGQGDYRGTVTVNFTVEKADRPTYDGQQTIEVDSGVLTLREIDLPTNWRWQNLDRTITNGMTATAEYVGEDSNNYNVTEITITITVKSPVEQPTEPTEPSEPTEPDDSEKEPPSNEDNSGDSETPKEDNRLVILGASVGGAATVGVGVTVAVVVIRRKRRLV